MDIYNHFVFILEVRFLPYKNNLVNLVLSGGGYKVKLYRPIFQALAEKGILQNITKVSGASGGALYALFLAIGMDHNDIRKIEEYFSIKTMVGDISFCNTNNKKLAASLLIKEILSFFKTGGIFELDSGICFIRNLLKDKLGNSDITFRQLHFIASIFPNRFKDLYISGTLLDVKNISYKSQMFSYMTTPDIKIIDALNVTVRYPLFFSPKKIIHKGRVFYWVDGGLSRNIPVCYPHFNPEETLVICFKRMKEVKKTQPKLFLLRYIYTIFRVLDQLEVSTIQMLYKFIIVIDPLNISVLKNASKSIMPNLIANAYYNTLQQLSEFEGDNINSKSPL
jgi:predicted acylesterase/phospholipase RssA